MDVPSDIELEGFLSKWSNYLKGGWRRRYFYIQQPGVLLYTNSKWGKKRAKQLKDLPEGATPPPFEPQAQGKKSSGRGKGRSKRHARGTINLHHSVITASEKNQRRIILDTATGVYFLRAKNVRERNRWVKALNNAKQYFSTQMSLNRQTIVDIPHEDDGESGSSGHEPRAGLHRSTSVNQLMGLADVMAQAQDDAETLISSIEEAKGGKLEKDRADALRTVSNRLQKSVKSCLSGLSEEVERTLRLEALVLELESQNVELRRRLMNEGTVAPPEEDNTDDEKTHDSSDSSGSDTGDFFDAFSEGESSATRQAREHRISALSTRQSTGSDGGPPALAAAAAPPSPLGSSDSPLPGVLPAVPENLTGKRFKNFGGPGELAERQELPCPKPSKKEAGHSLWSLLKDAIGKDLSKITLPAYFNEPLTVCQRIAEEIEYFPILVEANKLPSSLDRMAYVAAFAVSSYESVIGRQGKPFNPMLGETWEQDYQDKYGMRTIVEQVSHHPPITAFHTVHRDFIFFGDSQVKSKFWGNSLEIFPIGTMHLVFPEHGEHYTWQKVTTCISSLFGTRGVDHYGDMVITNHKTGENCMLKFHKKGWLSGQAEVFGTVDDANDEPRLLVKGKWNSAVYYRKFDASRDGRKRSKKEKFNPDDEDEPVSVVWKPTERPPNSAAFYELPSVAMRSNELQPELKPWLCPTDARLRPDQRLLEEGQFPEATAEKIRLEEKQRAARREREAKGEAWRPRYFAHTYDPDSGTNGWVYTGGYWENRAKKQWDDAPDIW